MRESGQIRAFGLSWVYIHGMFVDTTVKHRKAFMKRSWQGGHRHMQVHRLSWLFAQIRLLPS